MVLKKKFMHLNLRVPIWNIYKVFKDYVRFSLVATQQLQDNQYESMMDSVVRPHEIISLVHYTVYDI